MSSAILVTGATSSISRAVIERLNNGSREIRAMVRHPIKAVAFEKMGVKAVIADLEAPSTLPEVFADVDAVFLLTHPGPRAPEHSSNAVWAARQAGVRRVVRLSAFGASHDAPTINGRLHALSDAELMASGLDYTLLKPHFFMQNLLMAAPSVSATGILAFPMQDARMGMIDSGDIAKVASEILLSHDHRNKSYTLTRMSCTITSRLTEKTGVM